MITERSERLRRFLRRGFIARNNDRRRRIQVVEQLAQSARTGASGDCHVPDDRQLVIDGYLRRFDLSCTNTPGATRISLDEIFEFRCAFPRDYHSSSVRQFTEECLEGGDSLSSLVEDVVNPCQSYGADRFNFEQRRADESAQLRRGAGNGQHRTALEDSAGASRARNWNYFDPCRSGQSKNRL